MFLYLLYKAPIHFDLISWPVGSYTKEYAELACSIFIHGAHLGVHEQQINLSSLNEENMQTPQMFEYRALF
jgi:hypothetical protein